MNPGLSRGSGRWLLLLGALGRCQRAISLEIPLRVGPPGAPSPPSPAWVPGEGAPVRAWQEPCVPSAAIVSITDSPQLPWRGFHLVLRYWGCLQARCSFSLLTAGSGQAVLFNPCSAGRGSGALWAQVGAPGAAGQCPVRAQSWAPQAAPCAALLCWAQTQSCNVSHSLTQMLKEPLQLYSAKVLSESELSELL